MDIEAFKSEILELLKQARNREVAEKLREVCKNGSYLFRATEECLKRIQKLEEEFLLSPLKPSDHNVRWNQISEALFVVVAKLTLEELESN